MIAKDTKFSHRREIHWESIGISASGRYECRANKIEGDGEESKIFELKVLEPQKPEIEESSFGETINYKEGQSLELKCQFTGVPQPQISWYKDNEEIQPKVNDPHIAINNDGTILKFHLMLEDDAGDYACVGINRFGTKIHETELVLDGKQPN